MNEKGFTLVEMILAVAMLAVASSFIVQYFISAHNLNEKAADLDQGVWLAQEALEAFKADDSSSAFRAGTWHPQDSVEDLLLRYTLEPQAENLYTLKVQVVRTKDYWLESQADKLIYEVYLTRYFKGDAGNGQAY